MVVLVCGLVGLLIQKFTCVKGAKRIIAVDNVPNKMNHSEKMNKVELIIFEDQDDAGLHIREITNGGADGRCHALLSAHRFTFHRKIKPCSSKSPMNRA